MVNVLHSQVELVGEVLRFPALLGTPVGGNELQPDVLFDEEGNNPVIQQIWGGDGAFVGVEFGRGRPAVGFNENLPVDSAHALDVAYVVGGLNSQVAWVLTQSPRGLPYPVWPSPGLPVGSPSGSTLPGPPWLLEP